MRRSSGEDATGRPEDVHDPRSRYSSAQDGLPSPVSRQNDTASSAKQQDTMSNEQGKTSRPVSAQDGARSPGGGQENTTKRFDTGEGTNRPEVSRDETQEPISVHGETTGPLTGDEKSISEANVNRKSDEEDKEKDAIEEQPASTAEEKVTENNVRDDPDLATITEQHS